MFVPIDQVLASRARDRLHIQETRYTGAPASAPPPHYYKRKRRQEGDAPVARGECARAEGMRGECARQEGVQAQDKVLQAERCYHQAAHQNYLTIIRSAYRSFTVES